MKLLPDWQAIDTTLFHTPSKTLVLGDLHIGAEEEFVQKGIQIPKSQHTIMLSHLNQVITKTNPKYIILNGDIKHSFGNINADEWRNVLDFFDLCLQHAQLRVIKGNHDAILEPVCKKRGIEIVDHIIVGDSLIVHGDKLIVSKDFQTAFTNAKTLIIGHEHPSHTLVDGVRTEKYKCFLVGLYEHKHLIVMPSFYPLVEGSEVIREQSLGPFLQKAQNIQLFLVGESDIFYFGHL